MKSSWEKLVHCLTCTGPLTDAAIERYELQGKYGETRQRAARARLIERMAKRDADRQAAIQRQKERKKQIHDLIADFV